MPRVKRGKVRARKRKAFLSQAKGYRWGRKNKIKLAKTAIKKAGVYAYRDRRINKRLARNLWQLKINAAVRNYDLSYSKFMDALKKNKIEIDRKILSNLAENFPDIFKQIVEKIKK